MLRFTVDGLAPVDLGGSRIVLGASPAAQLRLPAAVARDEHVVLSDGRWVALATLDVDGASRAAGESGPIGAGVTLGFGAMRVVIAPAPAGSLVSSPAHTASLALELVRGLLGANAAPSFEVERGPVPGAKRALPPPLASLVIGRGDEATWVILDEDLSRTHAEIQRGWDGVTIVDLGSKNGTKLDGAPITVATLLRDGMRIELGNLVLRFRDPAERHLRGGTAPAVAKRTTIAPVAAVAPIRSSWRFLIATAVAGLAVVGLVWVLAS